MQDQRDGEATEQPTLPVQTDAGNRVDCSACPSSNIGFRKTLTCSTVTLVHSTGHASLPGIREDAERVTTERGGEGR